MKTRHRIPAEPEILISTGIGRLHLLETAAAIQVSGRRVGLITGWAPDSTQRNLVNVVGRILGQRRLYDRLLDRRRLFDLEGCALRQCPLAEGAMTLSARFGLQNGDRLTSGIWGLFGRESRRHIHGAKVFHVRSGAGGGGAIETARRQGMKVVADHSIAHPTSMWKNLRENGAAGPEAEGFGPQSKFWGRVMRDCMRADAVLVNSDYVRRTMVEQGFDGKKIHVAYLGISREWLAVKTEHRSLSDEPIRALFLGHFVKRKGSHLLIEAARILREKKVRVEFHIAGEAHGGPAEAAAKGVAEMFCFHGLLGRAEVKTRLVRSDVFVFPTLAEGCAKAAMEALGAGLPVITTRECGLPEAAEACVRLVPLGQAAALAAAIAELGNDRDARARNGAAGAELVRRNFGPEHFATTVGTFYQKLIGYPERSASTPAEALLSGV